MNLRIKLSYIWIITFALFSCEGDEGQPGFNTLINSVPESTGTNCANGGIKVEFGLDKDRNNFLSSDEVTSTQYICNGNNGVADKVTRIEIPAAAANTTSAAGIITGNLIKFNKADYATDSIVFVTDPYTSGSGNLSIVELYNSTDDLPITGGALSTNATYENRTSLLSANIFNNLPDKEITIRVRTKSSAEGQFASNTGTGLYLFVYKK